MYNQTTNYQTSFNIIDEDGEVYRSIQRILYFWITQKESDHRLKYKLKEFAFRDTWKNLYHTYSSIATNTYLGDELKGWALQYQEKDTRNRRYWYTDVGLKLENGVLTISAKIAYAWDSEDLRADRVEPRATIPRFIRSIFKEADQKNWHLYSQNQALKISEKPHAIKSAGDGKFLAQWIQNPDRQFPLIVFNGRELVTEACDLSRSLVGKCIIMVVDSNPDLAEEIRQFLPKELGIGFGRFRVFFRINQKYDRPERHRWFDPKDIDYAQSKEGLITNLLRNHTLGARHTIEKITDVGRLINLSKLHSLVGNSPENQEQIEVFTQLLEDAENERDEFKQLAELYETEVRTLGSDTSRLEQKCQALEHAKNAQRIPISQSFPSLPFSLIECVRLAQPLIKERITITPDAIKSAESYSECKAINEAWQMLIHLHDTMYPMKFMENALDEKEFKRRTGIDYAKTEGKQTKANSKLSRMREISFEGKTYEIWPHLRVGNKGDKMLRIHFAFDEEKQRIIVGYIGAHMENSTSKNL
ncbi:hypothetical protein JIN77_02615 [Verrucomicrobiaceae bacterium R5-34]|nr:hypothetical protein [Verrucomicrobiaceae bacterium R5-34]